MLLGGFGVHASNAMAEEPPAAPADFILDEGRTLSASGRSALGAEVQRFRQETGCGFGLATVTYLSNKSIRDHASALADGWMQSGPGLVLAFDRATSSHAVAPTEALWLRYPTPALVEAFRETGVLLQSKAPLDERLASAARQLMSRLTEMERQQQRHQELLPRRERVAALVFLGVLILGSLIGSLILALIRRRDAAGAIRYFFPESQAAMRFGGPCGGGVIAELRLNPPPG